MDQENEIKPRKTCISALATRPILYTDTIKGGEQALRDDLWAVTTDELNAVHTNLGEFADEAFQAEARLRAIRAGQTKTVEFDLSPAMQEGAVREKLIELGWTPPAPASAGKPSTAGAAKGGNTNDMAGSSVAPIAASIEGLTRYSVNRDARGKMDRSAIGKYVRFEDVERLLATQSAKQGAQPSEMTLTPKWAGYFHSYQDWVNKAQSRLASPEHRRAICVDAKGRRCAIGKDFMVARDEGAFPVRYFWECEMTASQAAPEQAEPPRLNIDESREYLVKFMEQHFTDKTFHRYIRADASRASTLAGDFAWQMARALRMVAAPATQVQADVRAQVLDEAAPDESAIECWSRDEEDFNARSLEELLDRHDDLKAGDTVWVGEADFPSPGRLVSADSIIEHLGEQAYDIGGEYAEDYPDVSDEQAKELESLVADWIKRTCPPTFYEVKNIKPYVLSHDDFPGDMKSKRAASTDGDHNGGAA